MTEVQPELIICYLGLRINTYDNFEPYYFDADSVMTLIMYYLSVTSRTPPMFAHARLVSVRSRCVSRALSSCLYPICTCGRGPSSSSPSLLSSRRSTHSPRPASSCAHPFFVHQRDPASLQISTGCVSVSHSRLTVSRSSRS